MRSAFVSTAVIWTNIRNASCILNGLRKWTFLSHFAPWLRNYYSFCSVVIRILKFADAIEQVRRERSKLKYTKRLSRTGLSSFRWVPCIAAAGGVLWDVKRYGLNIKSGIRTMKSTERGDVIFWIQKNEDRLKAHVWYCKRASTWRPI